MMRDPNKSYVVFKKGAMRWRFTWRNGKVEFESSPEEDKDGWYINMPTMEDCAEITKILLDKVGCDACAEGIYSTCPGRPSRLKFRIVSPTH